jgi:glycosyltransferase involved in cell wall biosynthesis
MSQPAETNARSLDAMRPSQADAASWRSEQGMVDVFVHLARGFDAREWKRRRESNELIGINDPTPYCYGRAEAFGCSMRFSEDRPEGRLGKAFRLALRLLLGFDYLHARRNAAAIRSSRVVWTHTESQFLAVALLLLGARQAQRPKLLGQSVWFFDRWQHFSRLRRAFYARLVREVDVLTVHSPDNFEIARAVFPDKWIEIVYFGIPEHGKVGPRLRTSVPARVLCVGNDRHRDWATAVTALRNRENIELTIVSGNADPRLSRGAANIRITRVRENQDLLAAMDDATMMLVPLKPNHHASGITVIQEAVLRGLPVVATDTGGLRAYFDGDAVHYVPPSDPHAIHQAVLSVMADPADARRRAVLAQARMGPEGLGGDAFVARHVELTRALLKG